MSTPEIVVIGAGPAGIRAALEAARAGASVLILDEHARPGGQYYRQPIWGLPTSPNQAIFAHAEEGHAQIAEAMRAGVQFLTDALVWGVFAEGAVAILSAGKPEVLTPSKLILASGGHERPVAFPGWTLPGVITAGAAQALLRGQGLLPGRRILMAGTGPLQVAVAAQLTQAGAHLAGVLEANSFSRLVWSGPRFWGQWGRVREALKYCRILRSGRVPLIFGRAVVRAVGNGELSGVITAELDEHWHPIAATEAEVKVDTLCLGFGLVPNTRLARLLGCELAYVPARGGLVPVHDDNMQTSKPGLFVAGEAAGIAGATAAELQGRIAGISAALQLGKGDRIEAEKRIQAAQRELERELRFARSLNEIFAVKPGLLSLVTDDTVICRCEEITLGQLRRERSEWLSTLDAVRKVSRAGMGLCQGTMCEPLVAQLLGQETGKVGADLGSYHIRPPLKPISVGALADLSGELPPPPNRMER